MNEEQTLLRLDSKAFVVLRRQLTHISVLSCFSLYSFIFTSEAAEYLRMDTITGASKSVPALSAFLQLLWKLSQWSPDRSADPCFIRDRQIRRVDMH